jgi:hypothetical protein
MRNASNKAEKQHLKRRRKRRDIISPQTFKTACSIRKKLLNKEKEKGYGWNRNARRNMQKPTKTLCNAPGLAQNFYAHLNNFQMHKDRPKIFSASLKDFLGLSGRKIFWLPKNYLGKTDAKIIFGILNVFAFFSPRSYI